GSLGFTVTLQSARWEELLEPGFTAFFLSDGVFLSARLLFGLLAPLVLVGLTWGCLRVESNQSATGILYVIVAFVFLGELLSKRYLLSSALLF
ncbi:MAG: hypothetical protein AAF517_14480, partial [Planctomycetota bacterium]